MHPQYVHSLYVQCGLASTIKAIKRGPHHMQRARQYSALHTTAHSPIKRCNNKYVIIQFFNFTALTLFGVSYHLTQMAAMLTVQGLLGWKWRHCVRCIPNLFSAPSSAWYFIIFTIIFPAQRNKTFHIFERKI